MQVIVSLAYELAYNNFPRAAFWKADRIQVQPRRCRLMPSLWMTYRTYDTYNLTPLDNISYIDIDLPTAYSTTTASILA